MKKVILSMALALACVTGATAQKQAGGEKSLEVQFAPLSESPVSISGIRLRIFNSESSAIRLGVNLGGSKSEEITQATNTVLDSLELIDVNKTFNFSIRPGFEMHLAGTDRLSPYVGAELVFGMSNTTSEFQEQYPDDQNKEQVMTTIVKGGTSTFGLSAVAGADFYFSDAIYLGAELSFGFASTKDKEIETTFQNPKDDLTAFTTTKGNVSSSSWGPTAQGTIRLGWLFN
jgi:hypothetical protein